MEIYLPTDYPDINWSRATVHEDRDPEDTFGLISFRIGPSGWRMREDHTLFAYAAPGMEDSLLIFGIPKSPKIWAYSPTERLFSLEDASRINQIVTASQELITVLRQMRTAGLVIASAIALLDSVKQIDIQEDPEIVSGAGVIKEFINAQEEKLKPDNSINAAKKLVRLGVREVQTVPSILNTRYEFREIYQPEWLIENLPKYSRSRI